MPKTDPRGFVTSAYQLGLDQETRRMLGLNARIVASRCSPEAMLSEFEALLLSLTHEDPDACLRAVA